MENNFLLAQSSGGFFVQIIPLILIFAIFWFLIIRPQQKKIKDHNTMVSNVKKGDRVVTGGGLIGTVTDVSENEVDIDFGNNIKTVQCLLFLKASIAALPVSPEVAPKIVIDLFFLLNEVSKNCANKSIAKSLKARVGP